MLCARSCAIVLVFWAPRCSTAVGLGLQVWMRNPGPPSLLKTPAEPGLGVQPARRPVGPAPVAVCLPSLLNWNNSKGSYTEGQLWYCLFFQKQNKAEGWELQKGSSHVDVRSQSKTAALLSNHQTLPCSRLSFRAVTPQVRTGAPVFQIKPRQPRGQGVACSVP